MNTPHTRAGTNNYFDINIIQRIDLFEQYNIFPLSNYMTLNRRNALEHFVLHDFEANKLLNYKNYQQ